MAQHAVHLSSVDHAAVRPVRERARVPDVSEQMMVCIQADLLRQRVDAEVFGSGSSYVQRERDEFRRAAAALVRTLDTSDECANIFPLLGEVSGVEVVPGWRPDFFSRLGAVPGMEVAPGRRWIFFPLSDAVSGVQNGPGRRPPWELFVPAIPEEAEDDPSIWSTAEEITHEFDEDSNLGGWLLY